MAEPNPYLDPAVVERFRQRRQGEREGTLRLASDLDPAKHGKVLELAEREDLPPSLVSQETEAIERDAKLREFPHEEVERSPALREFFGDVDSAAVGLADPSGLVDFGRALRGEPKAPTEGEIMAGRWERGASVASQYPIAARPLFREALGGPPATAEERLGWETLLAAPAPPVGSSVELTPSDMFGPAWEQVPLLVQITGAGLTGGGAGALTAGAAGSVIPGVGTAAGATAGFGIGFKSGMAISVAQIEASTALGEFWNLTNEEGNPLTLEEKAAAALAVGGINAGLELLGFVSVARAIPGLSKLLDLAGVGRAAIRNQVRAQLMNPATRGAVLQAGRRVAMALGIEMGTEVGQETTTIQAGRLLEGKGVGFTPEEGHRLLETAIETAKAVSVIAGAGQTVNVGLNRIARAKQNAAQLEAAREALEPTEIREISPSLFRRLSEKIAKEAGILDISIPVEHLLALYEAEGGGVLDLIEDVPEAVDQFTEARETGGDIVVPVGRFFEKLDPRFGEKLTRDVRLRPEDLTLREAEEAEAGLGETVERAAPKPTEPEVPGLDRLEGFGPMAETIGGWLERHAIGRTPEGLFVLYHATPTEGGATTSLREGSYLAEDPESAAHFAARDRDLTPEQVTVHKLHLTPDEIRGGVHATLRQDVDIATAADATRRAVPAQAVPGVVFHGTPATDITLGVLDPRAAIETEGVIFFSTSEDIAAQFTLPREYGELVTERATGEVVEGEEIYEEIEPGPIIGARLDIRNPLIIEGTEAQEAIDDTALQGQRVRQAKEAGHDAVIFKDVTEFADPLARGDVIGVFGAGQIRSPEEAEAAPTDPSLGFEEPAEVADAHELLNLDALFGTPEDAGMTERGFQQYQESRAAGKEEAATQVKKEGERRTKRKVAERRKNQKAVRQEVTAEVDAEPVYNARNWLRRGRLLGDRDRMHEGGPLFTTHTLRGDLSALTERWEDKGLRLRVVENKEEILLDDLVVPKEKRKRGIGGEFMEELVTLADSHGRTVTLLPAVRDPNTGTTSRSRLVRFYKRFGFVENKGRNKDFRRGASTMFRRPRAGALESAVPHVKLDTDALVATYGAEILEQIPKSLRQKTGGLPTEIVAQMFGYTSGDELVQDLVSAQERGDEIKARTAWSLYERYGDLQDPAEALEQGFQAANNEKQIRSLLIEDRTLSKRVGGRPSTLKLLRDQAREIIAKKKARDLKPHRHRQDAARAARRAAEAWAAGNEVQAQAEKRRQMLNMALEVEAREQLARVERAVAYQTRFDSKTTRGIIGKAGHGFLEQIDAIRERVDFRKSVTLKAGERRKSLREWIEEREEEGDSFIIPDRVRDEAYRTPYREMTVEEIIDIRDSLVNLEHLARRWTRLYTDTENRLFDEVKDELIETIREYKKARPRVIETRGRRVMAKHTVEGWFAGGWKLASMARIFDGVKDGGAWWQAIVRGSNVAGNFEADERAKASKKMFKLFARFFPFSERAKGTAGLVTAGLVKPALMQEVFIPEIGRSLTTEGRLMVAFQWGTKTNRQRIMGGYKWSEAQVEAILNTLTAEDWQFIENVWAYIGSYWDQIAAKEERVTGVAPQRVEAVPFVTPFGEVSGGYVPIKYDDMQSARARADTAAEVALNTMRGNYSRATTRRGFTITRLEEVNRPVRLDFGVLFAHVNEVIHDLAYHEWLIDANKILGDREIQDAILETYGPAVYQKLQSHVTDIAIGDVAAQDTYERVMAHLRKGSSIAGLGLNVFTGMLQVLGLTQSMVRIGPKWVMRGASRWFRGPEGMVATVRWIHENSTMMRLRPKTMQREVAEVRNRVARPGITSGEEDAWFYFIVKSQQFTDNITWLGGYEKAMAEMGEADLASLDEAKAFALADQAVLDSQSGGQIKDLAEWQRGSPMRKLWTNFYSYFSATLQLGAETFVKTHFRKPGEVGRFAVDMLLLWTLPATLEHLGRKAFRGDDFDDEGLLKELLMAQAEYAMGTMILVREMAGFFSGFAGYDGPAGTRFFSSVSDLVAQVAQGEVDTAAFKALNDTAGILFHKPAVQIGRLVTGAAALLEDETNNPLLMIPGPPRKKK